MVKDRVEITKGRGKHRMKAGFHHSWSEKGVGDTVQPPEPPQ